MNSFAGTGALVGAIIRRDRLRLFVWTAGILIFMIPSIASLPEVYRTAADRQARAGLADNPAFVLFSGPGHGLDNYTFGAMVANEMLGFFALLLAFMSIFLVVRHTRAEEQYGRTELVRAAVVGRFAVPAASLVVVGGLNVLIGVATALTLPGLGMDLSPGGSVTFAVAGISVGLVFAGIALFTSQLSEYSRGATGLASAILGLTYLLRAAGDIGGNALSWLSPFGWAQATQAYVDDRLWPALFGIVVAVGITVAALAMSASRDVGAGLLPARRGSAVASAQLARPVGFAIRMQRGALIGWSVGMVVFGAVYGTLVSSVEEFAAENETIQDFLVSSGGGTFLDAFLSTIVLLVAVIIAGLAIQSSLRPRTEENTGRIESVLATPISRLRWLGGYLVVTLVASAAVMVASGLALGGTAALTSDDPQLLGSLLAASAAYIPALWVVVGVAVALFGLVPRFSALAWAVLAYAVTVAMLGGVLGFPDWVYLLSPFGHVPAMPAEAVAWGPLAGLTLVAGALVAVGVAGFRRRDLELS